MPVRFDSMEVTVSVVGAVSLECKDGSLCVVSGKGNRRQRLQLVTRNSPKGMSKIE